MVQRRNTASCDPRTAWPADTGSGSRACWSVRPPQTQTADHCGRFHLLGDAGDHISPRVPKMYNARSVLTKCLLIHKKIYFATIQQILHYSWEQMNICENMARSYGQTIHCVYNIRLQNTIADTSVLFSS